MLHLFEYVRNVVCKFSYEVCDMCDKNKGPKYNRDHIIWNAIFENKEKFKCELCEKKYPQKKPKTKETSTTHEFTEKNRLTNIMIPFIKKLIQIISSEICDYKTA